MRKFIVAIALLLGACGTTNMTADEISDLIHRIQVRAEQVCQFRAESDSVRKLIIAVLNTTLPGSTPITQIAEQLGNAICDAPVLPGASRYGATGKLVATPSGSVVVTGHYLSTHRRGAVRVIQTPSGPVPIFGK